MSKKTEAIDGLRSMHREAMFYYYVMFGQAAIAIAFGIYAAMHSPLVPALGFAAVSLWYVYMAWKTNKHGNEIKSNYNKICRELMKN